MLRILLDENLPVPMRRLFREYEADHVRTLGWNGLANGRLIAAAERAGYEVLVTADQSVSYQQNLASRNIALVVLSTNRWSIVQAEHDTILSAVKHAAGERREKLGRLTLIRVELGPK